MIRCMHINAYIKCVGVPKDVWQTTAYFRHRSHISHEMNKVAVLTLVTKPHILCNINWKSSNYFHRSFTPPAVAATGPNVCVHDDKKDAK